MKIYSTIGNPVFHIEISADLSLYVHNYLAREIAIGSPLSVRIRRYSIGKPEVPVFFDDLEIATLDLEDSENRRVLTLLESEEECVIATVAFWNDTVNYIRAEYQTVKQDR